MLNKSRHDLKLFPTLQFGFNRWRFRRSLVDWKKNEPETRNGSYLECTKHFSVKMSFQPATNNSNLWFASAIFSFADLNKNYCFR